jgi:hypothetical protein
MRSLRIAVVALAVVVGTAGLLHADVIHLKNGNRLEVEGWKDAGEVIEFMMGGGIIRISKTEIQKIDGKPSSGDFKMYSSGTSTAAATGPVDAGAAISQMSDLLQQGAALFSQTVLSASEKVGAFRRLSDQWRALDVPDPVRPAHSRGEAAIRMAVEAFGADEDEQKSRADKARAELASVQDEVKKLGAQPAGGTTGG